MAYDQLLVYGLKTAEREWFALLPPDNGLKDVGLEPNLGRSEAELRRQLRYLGLSEVEIDERFRNARKWMTTASPRL